MKTSTSSSGHCFDQAASTSHGPAQSSSSAPSKRKTPIRRGLTLVGITVAGIESDGGGVQLQLALDEPGGHALDAALDAVHERFGPRALQRAALLGRDPGLAAFLEPGDGGARE